MSASFHGDSLLSHRKKLFDQIDQGSKDLQKIDDSSIYDSCIQAIESEIVDPDFLNCLIVSSLRLKKCDELKKYLINAKEEYLNEYQKHISSKSLTITLLGLMCSENYDNFNFFKQILQRFYQDDIDIDELLLKTLKYCLFDQEKYDKLYETQFCAQSYQFIIDFLAYKLSQQLALSIAKNSPFSNRKLMDFFLDKNFNSQFEFPCDLVLNLALYKIAFENLDPENLEDFFKTLNISEKIPNNVFGNDFISVNQILEKFKEFLLGDRANKFCLMDESILKIDSDNKILRTISELGHNFKKIEKKSIKLSNLTKNINKIKLSNISPKSHHLISKETNNGTKNETNIPTNYFNFKSLAIRYLRTLKNSPNCQISDNHIILKSSNLQFNCSSKKTKKTKSQHMPYKGDPEKWIPIHLRQNHTLPKTKKNSAKIRYKETIMQGVPTEDLVDSKLDISKVTISGDVSSSKKSNIPIKVVRRKKTSKRR